MRYPILPLTLIPVLFLQGCLRTWTTEAVQRSSSTIASPPAAIHVPAADEQLRFQGGVTLEGGPGSTHDTKLSTDGGSGGSSWAAGPTMVSRDPLGVGIDGALWIQRWLRVGIGAGFSRTGVGLWTSNGVATPGPWPLELFVELDGRTVSTQADWRKTYHAVDPENEQNDSTVTFSSTADTPLRLGERVGLHFGRRDGGPWIEGSWGRQELFDAPVTEVSFAAQSVDLAVGWMQRFGNGALVAYVRTRRMGDGWLPPTFRTSEWSPSAGLQWTGEWALTSR
jgi:hypothetical protein